MHKNEKQSQEYGKSSFKYAWFFDGSEEERKRGITIDLTVNCFDTPNRHFNIIDAPGHQDFVPNMIAGAAQADVAVLVIDGNTSAFENGWGGGGTKEHAILARSLGVTQLLVGINKLDLIEWDQARYDEIQGIVEPFLLSIGFVKDRITFLPISGLLAVNLDKPAEEPLLKKWYSGKCLVELLDEVKLPQRPINKPLRVSIYDHYKSSAGNVIGDCVQAKVEAGILKEG